MNKFFRKAVNSVRSLGGQLARAVGTDAERLERVSAAACDLVEAVVEITPSQSDDAVWSWLEPKIRAICEQHAVPPDETDDLIRTMKPERIQTPEDLGDPEDERRQ